MNVSVLIRLIMYASYRLGRKDAAEAECTPDGRLPDATKAEEHL